MKKVLLILMLLLCFLQETEAQYYSTGQDRATISWHEIETNEFQLVYPDYFESQAQGLANLLFELYRKNSESLGVKAKKISILLHTESTTSNGYVTWAPRRSEMYTSAPDVGLGGDWLTHLATHEYRHVVQMDKLNETLPKILTAVFGEQILPFVLSYKVPMWFMEGDAVLTETLMSDVGRGRSADFLQVMKAYLVENEHWHEYDKANLGSYKDFVPSIYHLGYSMVANARRHYGKLVWKNALSEAGKKPYPWHNFLKKEVTKEKRSEVFQKISSELENQELEQKWRTNKHCNPMLTLYNDNMLELQTRWREEIAKRDTTAYQKVSSGNNCYTNYQYPQLLADGSVVAYKTGFDNSGQIVQIINEKEKVLYTPGYLTSALQRTGEFLYWVESVPDIRWQEKAKYVLCVLHIPTKKLTQTIFKNTFRMPTINADNKLVAVVERQPNDKNRLFVFERETGKIKYRASTGNKMLFDPQFISDTTVACIFKERGAGIMLFHLSEKKKEIILPERNTLLKDLSCDAENLYFTASYTGTNEIYRYSLKNKRLEQLTKSRYGASQANVSDTMLCYANYTVKGYEIVQKAMKETSQKEAVPTDWQDDFLLEAVKKQEKKVGELTVLDSTFSSKSYQKWKHLFNFHSRSPFAVSTDEGYDLGISTTSQNLLSTMFVNLGYRRQDNYKNGQFYANLTYEGWFPILSTTLTCGNNSRQLYALLKKDNLLDTALLQQNKKRWQWKSQLTFPFNISRGKYIRNFSVSAAWKLTRDANLQHSYLSGTNPFLNKGGAVNLNLEHAHNTLTYSFYFANLHKKAYRDLYTPFGQQFSFRYQHTPFSSENKYTYAASGVLYLPSLIKHHRLKVYGGYQYQSGYSEFFDDAILRARGTSSLVAERKYSLRTTYKFPLAYPDWNLGRAVYIKRLKAGLFYDYSRAEWNNLSENAQSYGVELTADTHFIQIPIPVDWGVRVGYETQSSKAFFNFLLSLNF